MPEFDLGTFFLKVTVGLYLNIKKFLWRFLEDPGDYSKISRAVNRTLS